LNFKITIYSISVIKVLNVKMGSKTPHFNKKK